MKFCPNCGAKLDNDNFKFCPECGYNFESNASNSNTQGSGGLISSFIKGIRNEVQDNETLDDMVTHAKIIWHGPQTEKEKAYKERKRQEEEKKDPVKYKISEVTGKHLSDSPYFMERKKLFNVSDGYTYYKDILKWEVKNNALEYDDIEARLDELLKINDARTIFELRIKRPTYLFKTREDLEQYIGYGTAKNPIPIADEEIEKLTEKGFDRSAALKKILSEEKHKKKYGLQREEIPVKKKVDNNINQGTEKPKETPAATTKKAISTKQKTYEPDYSKLELSDLQETLIKTLPIINNPSEYEENIINKYAEYNSDERKELLKDCWTVTKLANEHNIKRHEVEKSILTDEFLNKDLIGVFKVNPNNIRSLKILYRKPSIGKQQKEEIKQPKRETSTETTQNNNKGKKTKIQGKKRELFRRRSPEEKVKWGEEKVKQESANRPENALFYIDGREGTLAIFEEYIQLDFTGSVVKQYLSKMGGVKKIYYPQINSIQKRDSGKIIMGSIEFEVPGMSYSGRGGGKSENIIHYDYYYQDEADKIYEFVNQKILNIQRNAANVQSIASNNSSVLSEIKKAKELLDMGAITQEEFDNIKKELL